MIARVRTSFFFCCLTMVPCMDAPPFVDQVIVDICFQSTLKGFLLLLLFLINVLALVQEPFC